MATDATGAPTSPDTIPTFNTSADAPSGLGFNAAMAQIQVALSARTNKPAGIVTGETIVYNGTTFARSSITNLSVSSLAPGSNGQILTTTGGVPVWSTGTAPGYAITLPGSPTDGQEAVLVDSLTVPTYQWRFRWNNGSSNTDKWEFVGGSPAFVQVLTSQTTASLTYAVLGTAGPLFALPKAGVYVVENGAQMDNNSSSSGAFMSYDIGGTAAVDADRVGNAAFGGQNSLGNFARSQFKTGLTAVTLTSKYRAVGAGTATFADRWMRVTPVRVS